MRALYFAGHCGGAILASAHSLLTSPWSSKKISSWFSKRTSPWSTKRTSPWSSKRTSPWSSNKTSSRSSERRMILVTLLTVSSGGVGHLVLMDLLKTLTLTLWKLYYHEFGYYTTKLSSLTTLLKRQEVKWPGHVWRKASSVQIIAWLPYECSKFRRKITIDVDVILAYMKMRTKKLMLLLVLKMMLMKALA